MKILSLIFAIAFIQSALAQEIPNSARTESVVAPLFDQVRWKKLMNLIDSEIKTIKGNRYSGPDLKHRLFELYSERIKLIKEKENLNLLKADPRSVALKGKESFFKLSQEQYRIAQSYALTIIDQYPKYQKIAEIFYALAINSRDYGTSTDTEKFLKLAISNGNSDSKTIYNAKTALAEHYYNSKRYHEAVGFYTDVLKKSDNEWYGKHLYNAGWCHLKERNFKTALELIKLSFETTKSKKYVSMKEQILVAIGTFFVQADSTYEGIEFFEANTSPSSPHLIGLANSSMNKNNFSITEDVLKAALKDARRRKDSNSELKVRLTQLDIYRESKKDEQYFETASSIFDLHKKNKLDKEDLLNAQRNIKEVAGFMQINLIKDKTKNPVEYNKEDYKKIMRYFDILSSLDKTNKKLYRYYQGETALSAQDYKTALQFYVRSIMNARITKASDDTNRKSLEAMLATIELANLPRVKENEYTIFAFKNYLVFYPVSDKSQTIYQKLFNKYYEIENIKKALNVLMTYKYFYKGDKNIHREMLSQVLDYYIKEKNIDQLAFWIGKIEKGYLAFSQEYIQKSITVLGGLLFNRYQTLEKNGQIKEALKGYESIFDSKQYPRLTKAEAAYAIAAIYLEQNNSKDSYKWLKRSLEIYENKDLIKVTNSLFVLAKGYRLLQNFEIATEIAFATIKRMCTNSFKNKEDFYQLVNENIIIHQKDINFLLKVENELGKCKFPEKLVARTQVENIGKLIFADRYKDALTYFRANSSNPSLIKVMEQYLQYKFHQSPETVKKDLSQISNVDLSKTITQHDQVVDLVKKINSIKFIFTSEEKFNEDKFNFELEQYFSIIAELNNEAIALAKKSGPEEIVMIQSVLSRPYFSLVKEINSYLPKGVDERYLAGFKQGMRQITESLSAKGLQIDSEKRAFLEKNNYFFEIQKNAIFNQEKNNSLQESLFFHSAILFSNTMDIGSTKSNERVVAGQ